MLYGVDVVNSIVGLTKILSLSAVAVSSIVLICMYIYGVTESTFMLVTKAVLMFISGLIYTAIPSDILGVVLRTNFGSPGMTIVAWSVVASVIGVFGVKLVRNYKGMMWVSPKEVDCASNS
ncbi:hypothetical protein [Bacillus mycoides]|uniref:hypothetical protein n=1 Tax=Bacillus mycoides TaxID=1405 RepID=UPI003A7F6FB9